MIGLRYSAAFLVQVFFFFPLSFRVAFCCAFMIIQVVVVFVHLLTVGFRWYALLNARVVDPYHSAR